MAFVSRCFRPFGGVLFATCSTSCSQFCKGNVRLAPCSSGDSSPLFGSPSPLTTYGSPKVTPQINAQYPYAQKRRSVRDEPSRKVGIHHCIEHTHQKGPMGGLDACASFEPRFGHRERAR